MSSASLRSPGKTSQLWLLVPALFLIAGAGMYFHPLLALWLVLLGGLTYYRPLYGISLLFLVISIDLVRPVPGGIFISYSEFEFGTCLLAWLAASDWKSVNWRPLLWGVPFLGVVLLSSLVNLPLYKVPPHLARSSEIVLALWMAPNALRDRDANATFRWALLIAAFFYTFTGFPQYYEAFRGRIFSFFTNPNQFAGYLIFLLPFCLAFFFSTAGRWIRLLWAYAAITVFLALLFTLSRTAFLGALASSILIWIVYYKYRVAKFWKDPFLKTRDFLQRSGPVLAAHLIPVLLIGGLWAANTDPLVTFQRSFEDVRARSLGGLTTAVEQFRLPYFQVGWEIWKDHPLLGIGPGRLEDVVPHYQDVVDQFRGEIQDFEMFEEYVKIHVHSLYLQLAVDYGLLGLLAFLFLIGNVLHALWKRKEESIWALAGVGMITAYLVHNVFDVTFPSLAMETGLLLGAALQINSCDSRDSLA